MSRYGNKPLMEAFEAPEKQFEDILPKDRDAGRSTEAGKEGYT